ncbi:MAG: nucleotide exchange factor GrpE [Promethearchaeota archaeon]
MEQKNKEKAINIEEINRDEKNPESKNHNKSEEFPSENSKTKLLLEHFSKHELLEKIKTLESELENKKEKLKEEQDWKNRFMRLQAEFENAQKRWTRDRNNLRIQHIASVLKKFLPLYDSFKKATDNNPYDDNLKQFFNQFLNILKAEEGMAVMNINTNDIFDYNYHEALNSIECDDLPNNSIIDIVQDGWMLGKEVLRYAKVITSRKPKLPVNIEEKQKSECSSEGKEIQNNDETKS